MDTNQDQGMASQVPAAEQSLLAGVEPRIFRSTAILGVAGIVACWLARGGGWAAGFAIGAVLSALSFHWMKGAISSMATAAAAPAASETGEKKPRPSGAGIAARFVLRYALIGVAGYVIFRSSAVSLAAFFAGLFVAVAAILAEVAYQIYLGLRSPQGD